MAKLGNKNALGHKHTKEAIEKMRIKAIGRKHTPETKQKLSKIHTDKKLSEETKLKMGLAHKGYNHTEEAKLKCSITNKGRKHTDIARKNMSNARIGHKASLETRLKMSKSHKGEKSYLWKGGISNITKRIRFSFQYKEWRQRIFFRDDFTCQDCKEKGGKLNAHHIKPFHILIKEAKEALPLFDLFQACMVYSPLWDTNNGKTLCEKCHDKHKKESRRWHA